MAKAKVRKNMVDVAQLVRAPDCDSGGRGFEPHLSPKKIKKLPFEEAFSIWWLFGFGLILAKALGIGN